MKEKLVYFVRHGQSTANGTGVFQGGDSTLTDLGKRQAAFVAKRFKDLQTDSILSSPMPRALETAQAIAHTTGAPLETHEVFREYLPPTSLIGARMDTDEGRAYTEALREHYEEPGWHYADEDSYFDLHERACAALDLLEASAHTKIAVVSHAGFMRVLFTAMLSKREPDPRTARRLARFLLPENTGITVCRYRPQETKRNVWRMITWNDHAHLGATDKAEPVESQM